jgi:hypothetical protein
MLKLNLSVTRGQVGDFLHMGATLLFTNKFDVHFYNWNIIESGVKLQ